MDTAIIAQLMADNWYLIIVFCYIVGAIVKSATGVNNKYIPLIVFAAGAVLGVALIGATVQNCLLGAVCGFASTGINQLKILKDSGNES